MTAAKRHEDHVVADTLLDYFEGRLGDAAEHAIEEHVAHCIECTALARRAFSFDAVWETWTAPSHGDAQARAYVVEALATASAGVGRQAWRERLQRWQAQWQGAAEAGLRLAIEAAGDASRVFGEALDGLTRPGSSWKFQPEASAAAIRGGGRVGSSAVFTTSLSANEPRARVAVEAGDRASITVLLDHLPRPTAMPLVLLIRADSGGVRDVRVEQLEPRDQQFVARFENVHGGEYIVALEPLA